MSHPIEKRIEAIRRRIAQSRLATGVCWCVASVVTAGIVLGLADYTIRYLDTGLQLLATVALIGAAGWAIGHFVWPPLRHPVSSLAVTQRIQRAFPQLEDRLASSFEFLRQPADDPAAGSATLRRAVVTDTSTRIEDLPLESIVDRRPLQRAATAAGIVVAILLLALLVDTRSVGTAAARLIAPLGSAEWPRKHQLSFRDLPDRLAAGETFEAELVDERSELPEEVTVHYRLSDAAPPATETHAMQRIGDVMVARREEVSRSFEIRATGGDHLSMPWHKIEVVEPPRLAEMSVTTYPPAYTGLPAETGSGHLEVLSGTELVAAGRTNKPLGAARVRLGEGESIEAEVTAPSDDDRARGAWQIPRDRWVASQSDTYWIELEDQQGLVSASERWHLRVDPDPPPSVNWQKPQADLYVLPTAVVPIAWAVKDNLQIHEVRLVYLRSDQSEEGEQGVVVYAGPDQAEPIDAAAGDELGEERRVEHAWQLEPLELTPGTQLTLHGHATDYRPGLGQTPAPRRVVILTREELDQRIADRQGQIARRLEQALELERTTREQVRRVEIQARNVDRLDEADRDTLQSARVNQRRIREQLTDPIQGVPEAIEALVAELAANGLENSELQDQMHHLQSELDRLGENALAAIDRHLTGASKSLQSDEVEPRAEVAPELGAATAGQQEVIHTLEGLLDELSQWAGFQRFAREVAQIRQQQLDLHEQAEAHIGQSATAGDQRQADLEKLSEAQQELTRRFDKLRHEMQQAADDLAQQDPTAASTLGDTLAEAQELQVSADLHEIARHVRENRVGRATTAQEQVAEDLQQLLNTLRNRHEQQLDRLVARLEQAERDLAELRGKLAELREEIEAVEQEPESRERSQQLEDLRRQADEIKDAIERMARRLERLQAERAGQSAQRAAGRLSPEERQPEGQPGEESGEEQQSSPPSADQARQAEEDLKEAAEQLAQQRRQAEQELAQQQMDRFATAIRDAIQQQQQLLEETQQLDELRRASGELTFAQLRTVTQLADQQALLSAEVHDFGEVVGSLGVFRLALEEAVREMQRATERLQQQSVDGPTQQAEQRALQRLRQIAESFERDQQPPSPEQGGGGSGGGGDQQQGPQLQLAEIKLLRLLQADLKERTTALRDDAARQESPENGTLQEAAAELASEQGRLAELVQDILTRDNESGPSAPAEGPPDEGEQLQDLLEQLDEQL